MHLIHATAAVLLSLAATAHTAERGRYLELVNRAHASVTAVAVAPAGSGRFDDKPIDPIAGGGGATTLRVDDAGCRYDLQVGFRDGRSVVYSNVDVCRGGKLVISSMPRDGRYALSAGDIPVQVAVSPPLPR
jgi:hypothetical protein